MYLLCLLEREFKTVNRDRSFIPIDNLQSRIVWISRDASDMAADDDDENTSQTKHTPEYSDSAWLVVVKGSPMRTWPHLQRRAKRHPSRM